MIAAIHAEVLATILVVAALLGASWMFTRGAGGTAITSLEAANRVLERRVQAQDALIADLQAQIAELQGKKDVSVVIEHALQPLFEQASQHERHVEERHLLTMHILQMIADRLGPERTGSEPI